MSNATAAPSPTTGTVAVSMQGIEKAFGANRVLQGVDFEVLAGEVHTLAGENGAGKSTLMKILQGVYSADAGDIAVDDHSVTINSPIAAREAGVGMVFQEFSLVPTLSVAQNVFLNREPRNALGLIDEEAMERETEKIFETFQLPINPKASVDRLSTAYWQLTEIAKAISQNARVLILDEPTASLSKKESEILFALIKRLTSQGIGIVYISHRMEEIYRVTDRITVMRDGAVVLTDHATNITPEDLVEAIIGRRLENALTYETHGVDRSGTPRLEVKGLSTDHGLEDISFTVHPGEVLGLAGLMGSGRTELARALFGIDTHRGGEILVDGAPVTITNPVSAMDAGFALVPEDRREQGLVLSHSIRDNLLLPLLGRFRRGPLMDERRSRQFVTEVLKKFEVKGATPNLEIRLLSGGNQQKVVLGRWVSTEPKILILDEPTAGIDIGTKGEVIELIRELSRTGTSVVLISSELTELLAVSDRILVLRQGRLQSTLDRSEIEDEESLQLTIQGV
ncbi:sugar ABC transporter ATP-binding protein [Kocuria rosea]|nr:sugar ABC transporter ATP-binding protein [Kocuria polaris]